MVRARARARPRARARVRVIANVVVWVISEGEA